MRDKGVFHYRTIHEKENICQKVGTFRELKLYVDRMKYRKAAGEDGTPMDLIKRSPEAFRRRCWTLINMILQGHYESNEEALEARVILLCKDQANPDLLSNFRLIALCNALYQLTNIIITSRLRT